MKFDLKQGMTGSNTGSDGIVSHLDNEETGIIIDKIRFKNVVIFRTTNGKFLEDKVFYEDDDLILSVDGIIYNYAALKGFYNAHKNSELLKLMYLSQGKTFINELTGEFSIVIFDKKENEFILYANKKSSKPIFYYKSGDNFIFSSSVKNIVEVKNNNRMPSKLNEIGAYYMLVFGMMLEDTTLVDGIRKVTAGTYVSYKDNKLEVIRYHRFDNTPDYSKTKKEIIDGIDNYFTVALKAEYDKDAEYGYSHIATLSGGMDSRANVMISKELGYKNRLDITCSYPQYLDEIISRKIAKINGDEYYFYPLMDGSYLKHPEEAVSMNNGLVYYTGSAHLLEMLKKVDFRKYGTLHTGMIGDGVLGSFIKNKRHEKPKLSKNAWYYTDKYRRIKEQMQNVYLMYENVEMFNLYNKCFNGVFNGNWTVGAFTECSSPFIHENFLEFVLKIPPEIKNRTKIEIEWLENLHPLTCSVITERYSAKPSIKYFELNYLRFVIKWGIYRYFGKHLIAGMVPFDYWMHHNDSLYEYIQTYFNKNSAMLSDYSLLRSDAKEIYDAGSFLKKAQVITLIEALKYLNL